ncbi:MAG TPA: hypothetical protein VIW29_00415, partial [Polyangiaceae bacterium]
MQLASREPEAGRAATSQRARLAEQTVATLSNLLYEFTEAPTLALRQNVIVNIQAHYVAASTPFALENRLRSWSTPGFEVGLKDYLGTAKNDFPGQIPLSPQFIVERARTLYGLGVRRYDLNVTSGFGASGPTWWALAKAFWELDNPQSVSATSYRQDFLDNAFGPANTDLKAAMDGFYKTIEGRALWSDNLVGLMYDALDQAFHSPGS